GDSEHLILKVFSESEPGVRDAMYARAGWQPLPTKTKDAPDLIVRHDRSALTPVSDWLATLKVSWWMHGNHWHKPVGKKFAEQFPAWRATIPPAATVLLDPALASFRNPTISAKVRLDVQESGIDWCDVKIALDVPDTTLTKAELKALLDARGGFVR